MKKSIIFFSIFFLFLFAQNAIAAEGDIIWVKTNNPTDGADTANKVRSDSSGLYVVGYEGYSSPLGMKMRIEKRRHADGNIIWEKTFNPRNQGFAEIYDIAIDGNFLYIAGANYVCCFNSDLEWRVEKRSLNDGNLIWSMGNNFSAGNFRWDRALGIAVDATGVYAAGRMQSGATVLWRVEKRSLADGSVIWSRTDDTGGTWAYDIAVDFSGVYAVGPMSNAGRMQWYAMKLSLFDGNNVLWTRITNFAGASNYPQAMSVNSSGVYTVGTNPYWGVRKVDQNTGNQSWFKTDDTVTSGYPYGVDVSDYDEIYIVGHNIAGSPDPRWRIEKRNASGILNAPWPKEDINSSPNNDAAHDVHIESGGSSIYVVGYTSNPSSLDTSWRIEKREIVITPICTGPVSIAWTDSNIAAGTTKIRVTHINELRANVNLRRQDAGLADYTWVDPTLTAGVTKIKVAHLQEIRNAISDAYTTCGQTAPTFTDSTLTAGATKIRKIHIDELRSAISSAP